MKRLIKISNQKESFIDLVTNGGDNDGIISSSGITFFESAESCHRAERYLEMKYVEETHDTDYDDFDDDDYINDIVNIHTGEGYVNDLISRWKNVIQEHFKNLYDLITKYELDKTLDNLADILFELDSIEK